MRDVAELLSAAGNATEVTLPEPATLFVKLSTAAPASSVQVVPLGLEYTRIEPLRSPVELNTVLQVNPSVPALVCEKSSCRSTAAAEVLSVVPVESRTRVPVPRCTPPVVPVTNVAVLAVVWVPFGIVPEPPAGTDA